MPQTLAGYLAYRDANPEAMPVSQFPARVAPAEKPPKYYDDWPWGDIVVYPDWLIFLSLHEDKSGPQWKKFLSELYEERGNETSLDVAEMGDEPGDYSYRHCC